MSWNPPAEQHGGIEPLAGDAPQREARNGRQFRRQVPVQAGRAGASRPAVGGAGTMQGGRALRLKSMSSMQLRGLFGAEAG